MLVSYCIVNTNGGELLSRCLDALDTDLDHEVLVLDNASDDGSAESARGRARLIEHPRRTGKAENDSTLLEEARGDYCLLLNEDSELRPGAAKALVEALERDPRAATASAQLLDPAGAPQPCAWRLPALGTALAGALLLHRPLVVQSGGTETREVGWAQSSAMIVRRAAAAEIGYLDPDFFVYSDETDFCKRLADAGWRNLYVPRAEAYHHEQLATDLDAERARIVEFHRNRDLYLRKHHGGFIPALARPLHAWPYLLRALAALALPNRDPRRYLLHARQALRPRSGEGIREAAARYNARLAG